jgi:hypothetical protein
MAEPQVLTAKDPRRSHKNTSHQEHVAGALSNKALKSKQEQAMKLNATQVKQTLSQFDAQVLPDDHPAVSQLNNLFGEHTFFLDNSGLKVLEPADAPDMKAQTGEIVSLADWSDATLTSLKPHEPELTGVVVILEPTQ